jgi:ABC-type glycerol-3-phosphate transport system permease component
MRKILFLSLVIILSLFPVVTAYSIEDSIREQINANSENLQVVLGPQTNLQEMLKTNPGFRTFFAKTIIFVSIICFLVILDLILKGFAMWRASKNNSKVWFWALLLITSFGVLPLLYLIFSKRVK